MVVGFGETIDLFSFLENTPDLFKKLNLKSSKMEAQK
jgi:hypothetical protein